MGRAHPAYAEPIDSYQIPLRLDTLTPLFSSLATTLKQLCWTQKDTTHEGWKTLHMLADLLPNLTETDLAGSDHDCCCPHALPTGSAYRSNVQRRTS